MDLDVDRAKATAEAHGLGKARARAIDARAGLGDAVEQYDVLVNAASYRVNLDAMRACLWGGCHYVDFGGLYWLTGRQLELNVEFERAGLLALLGMGSSPGKTNVMAVRAARELGERPRAIDVMAAGRDLDPPKNARRAGLAFPYAVQTLVDEVTMAPVVVRDGEPAEVEPLAPGGEVDFGEPVGTAETIYTLHSELRTFQVSFGCEEASFRLSLAPDVLKRLHALAQEPEEARQAAIEAEASTAVPPSPHTVSVHVVEALGAEQAVRVRAVTRGLESWGLGGGIVSTGAPAAAAVRLLARGRILATGVRAPETCVDPEDLFPELEQHGTSFDIEQRGLAGVSA
jgi:saccharopine dehydrogenase (NAD+, L-lysine-forming)